MNREANLSTLSRPLTVTPGPGTDTAKPASGDAAMTTFATPEPSTASAVPAVAAPEPMAASAVPTFATPGPIAVTVELPVGDVRVVASDRADTTVRVSPTDESRAADVRDAAQTKVERTPDGLLVKAPRQRGLGLLGKPGSVDITIELPAGSSLRGDSSVAAFHSAGRLGEVRIKTSVGNVDLDQTGRLDLSTGAGAITVARVDGDAEVSTGTGRIRLGEIDGAAVVKNANGGTRIDAVAGDLRISAGNGDLTVGRVDGNVTADAAHGEIRIAQVSRGTAALTTGFGQIELGLRPGTPARLDLFTSFGRVRNTLNPADALDQADAPLTVSARTSHGDITIRRA